MSASRSCQIVRASVLSFLLAIVPLCASAAEEGPVTLRFSPPAGEVLKYHMSSSRQMNFSGMDLTFISGHDVDMTLEETLTDTLGETTNWVSLTWTKSTSTMMRSGDLQEWDNPVKPQGRTVKVVVTPLGEVKEVIGAILGIPKGRPLEQYVDPWFIHLPEEAVEKGSTWTVDLDETEGEGDQMSTTKGGIVFELKKLGKKKRIPVAEMEGKGAVDIVRAGPPYFEGKAEVKIKAAIAIDGGYIVEMSQTVDTKGTMVSQDPTTGKEQEHDFAQSESIEIKLEK
jgi:hypothetical protein